MSEQITFFDLASQQDNQCWSPNPWKTRLVLNYKGLDYKTKYLEYPEIKPTLEKHLSPNEEDGLYTIPTILLPDGTYIMDSKKIVVELEKRYPSPPLHLGTSYLPKVEILIPSILQALTPELLPVVSNQVLNQASTAYWLEGRQKAIGLPLDQFMKEKGGEQAYAKALPFLQTAAELLKENSDGPFLEGEQITYADFVWAGMLRFLQRMGDDIFEKAVSSDKDVHLALLEACQPWLKRDTY